MGGCGDNKGTGGIRIQILDALRQEKLGLACQNDEGGIRIQILDALRQDKLGFACQNDGGGKPDADSGCSAKINLASLARMTVGGLCGREEEGGEIHPHNREGESDIYHHN